MSSDKYAFMWKPWFYYYYKHLNIEQTVFLINESIVFSDDRVRQIHVNEPDINKWTKRLREGLEQVLYENIFLCLEDVLFAKPLVDAYFFMRFAFRYFEADSLRLLTEQGNLATIQDKRLYSIDRLAQRSKYLISYAPSLWKKDFLLK